MKLLRFDDAGVIRLGVLDGDAIVPLDGLSGTYPSMLSIIAGGPEALDAVTALVASKPATIPLAGAALLAPLERPGKYLAIGMNYAKHVAESARLGVATPTQQFWFNKQTSCLTGPFAAIDPGVSRAVDYEVELGVVIGKAAKSVTEDEAPAHVFGYVVANDVSARDWQQHSPTFTMGKSFDTHGPIGPWIVTADEIPDPHALALRCLVNGELRQSSDTGQMIHNIWQQIAYLSTAFTLDPGDLLASGTPEGVGAGMTPMTWLTPGDVVRCEIDGIGVIENIVADRPN
jgi:2-keto-4-pentenoate hydratase/2-oxohepta-3-ene-1,7-dioic acid hydratase in catechol pathway